MRDSIGVMIHKAPFLLFSISSHHLLLWFQRLQLPDHGAEGSVLYLLETGVVERPAGVRTDNTSF